jgi:hypothetical protein
MLRFPHCLDNRLTVNCEILATCSSTYSTIRTSLEEECRVPGHDPVFADALPQVTSLSVKPGTTGNSLPSTDSVRLPRYDVSLHHVFEFR